MPVLSIPRQKKVLPIPCQKKEGGVNGCPCCFFQEDFLSEDERQHKSHTENYIKKRKKRNMFNYVEKVFEKAVEMSHMFTNFDIWTALSQKSSYAPTQPCHEVEWDDGDCPRIGTDCNEIPIVAHIPGFLNDEQLAEFTQHCVAAGQTIPLSQGAGADKNGRDHPGNYVHRENQIAGCAQFVRCWQGIGNPHLQPAPSASMTKNNRALAGIQVFIKNTNTISKKVNHFLSLLDPSFHAGLVALRKITDTYPGVAPFAGTDSLLMEGRSLIFNRQTPLHFDNRDLSVGWQVLIAGGNFKSGGSVYVPSLGLRLRLLPGDMVAIRGRLLAHKVEPWDGGQRISLVSFTHEDVWKYVEETLDNWEQQGNLRLVTFVGLLLMNRTEPEL